MQRSLIPVDTNWNLDCRLSNKYPDHLPSFGRMVRLPNLSCKDVSVRHSLRLIMCVVRMDGWMADSVLLMTLISVNII